MSIAHNFLKEKRAEADSNRGPSAYQPNVLPLGQTGSPSSTHMHTNQCRPTSAPPVTRGNIFQFQCSHDGAERAAPRAGGVPGARGLGGRLCAACASGPRPLRPRPAHPAPGAGPGPRQEVRQVCGPVLSPKCRLA